MTGYEEAQAILDVFLLLVVIELAHQVHYLWARLKALEHRVDVHDT